MDRIILIKQKAKSKGRRIDVAMDSSNERHSTGSVLGPILFVLFINDMPSEIKNTCKLFADDAKIFCNPLKTLLQHDINKLSQWS